MTGEHLKEIKARLNVARAINAIEDDEDDDCENNVSQFYEHDVSLLIAEVERLTLERDAAVADLREAIAASCDDECRFCKHANSPKCVACNADAENKCEWRGEREAANG